MSTFIYLSFSSLGLNIKARRTFSDFKDSMKIYAAKFEHTLVANGHLEAEEFEENLSRALLYRLARYSDINLEIFPKLRLSEEDGAVVNNLFIKAEVETEKKFVVRESGGDLERVVNRASERIARQIRLWMMLRSVG